MGILANTSVLKALCTAGRRSAALDHLRSIPSKRQRTPMYTWLLRACNEAGERGAAWPCCYREGGPHACRTHTSQPC